MTSHLYNDAESRSRGGSLAIVLLVGLVWIAMLAGDWWMRFAWYHWQTTLTARAIVAEGPDAPLVRQEVKETRGGDLTGLLGIPALARRFEQTRSATLNLSDEYGFRNIPPVKNRYFPLVAVGSSYIVAGETMSNTFSAALSRASGRDVYCYGWAARGPLFSVIRFLGDERFSTNPPRVMVWGLVEREIGGDMLAELVKRLKGLNEEPLGAGVPGGRRIAWSVLAPRSVQKSLPASSVIAHFSHRAWNGIRYYVFGQLGPDVCFAVRDSRTAAGKTFNIVNGNNLTCGQIIAARARPSSERASALMSTRSNTSRRDSAARSTSTTRCPPATPSSPTTARPTIRRSSITCTSTIPRSEDSAR